MKTVIYLTNNTILWLLLAIVAAAGGDVEGTKDLYQCTVLVKGKVAIHVAKYHYEYHMVLPSSISTHEELHLSFELPLVETEDGSNIFNLLSKDAQLVNTDDNRYKDFNMVSLAPKTCQWENGPSCTLNYNFSNMSHPGANLGTEQNLVIDHLLVRRQPPGAEVCYLDIKVATFPEAIEIQLSWIHYASSNISKLNVEVTKGFPLPVNLSVLICDDQEITAQALPSGYIIDRDLLISYNGKACQVTARNGYTETTEPVIVTVPIQAEQPDTSSGPPDTSQETSPSPFLYVVIALSCILGLVFIIGIVYCVKKQSAASAPPSALPPTANFVVHNNVSPKVFVTNKPPKVIVNNNMNDGYARENGNTQRGVHNEDEDGRIPDHAPVQPEISLESSDSGSSGFDETDGAANTEESPSTANKSVDRNIPFRNHVYPESPSVETSGNETKFGKYITSAPPTSSDVVHPCGEDKFQELDETQ